MAVNSARVGGDNGPAQKERKGLVVGAAAMMVAGFLTTILSPQLALSFAREFGFGIERAGLLVACGQVGVAISAFGVLPFLPRMDRRSFGIAGALVAGTCLVLTGLATGFVLVLVLQIVMGLGAGLCYSCANSALAYAHFPERAFSIVTITWTLVGAVMLTLGPILHDAWPKAGIYLGMATALLLCVMFMVRLPEVRGLVKDDLSGTTQLDEQEMSRPGVSPDDVAPRSAGGKGIYLPAVLLIAAMWMLQVGNAMVWTFVESIGKHAGLSTQVTATFLGFSQFVGLLGAGITLVLGARVPKMALIGPAVVILAVGVLLVGTAASPTPFIVGFLATNLAFFCLTPLLLALAADLDTSSGRLVVVAGGAALVAGAVAPAFGGWIMGSSGDWARLGVTALTLVALSLPLFVLPSRAAKRRTTPAG